MARTKFNNRPCSLSSITINLGTASVTIKLDTILPVNLLTVDSNLYTVDSNLLTVDKTRI